jgi:hypothetical protein
VRDLREQGSVQALAFNDPQRLEEALPVSPGDGGEAAPGGRGWDNDD